MSDDHKLFLETQRRRLEDAFFQKKDKTLIENLQKIKRMNETVSALAEVSGIRNEKVLRKLVELEVRPETLATLAVIPLIEVAWADGRVSKDEEAAVLTAAAALGKKAGSVAHDLIKEWLRHRPPAPMLEAWIHYIQGLCENLTERQKEALKSEIISHARKVAEASGGILGIGAISAEEKSVLGKMEKAFG